MITKERPEGNFSEDEDIAEPDRAISSVLKEMSAIMAIADTNGKPEEKTLEVYRDSLNEGLQEARRDSERRSSFLKTVRKRGGAIKTRLLKRH